jgi:glutamine cyclotransferase
LPDVLTFRNVVARPHDSTAFTQGLLFSDGKLYESTGLYGRSTLRIVEPASGKVVRRVEIPRDFFAEGLELVGDSLYLLTWRERRCFVFDSKTLKKSGEFTYDGEGWGICFDGESLIMSDGTAILRYYDPKNFKLRKKVTVFDGDNVRSGQKIMMLNELEFVHGEVWANIWKTTKIVRINPQTGKVIGWIDLKLIAESVTNFSNENVLNGIAFDEAASKVFITGKNWNVLFEMDLIVK